MHGQEILIDYIFIHEQLGISKEGAIDATNATFDKAKTILKKIASPNVTKRAGPRTLQPDALLPLRPWVLAP
jgi:hypothetical protein